MELHDGEIDSQIHQSCVTTSMTPDLPLTLVDKPNKRRRKKSIVWDYFTVQTVEDGCIRAYCNQCNKSFAYITGSKLAGTSHLKRHIALGICPVSRERNQSNCAPTTFTNGNAANPPRKRYRATPTFVSIPFDQNRCNHDIAIMIIMHEYPLDMVEQAGFIDFVRSLQPQFNMMSYATVQEECTSIYLREKESLLNFVCGIPSRISLSLDVWISSDTTCYVFLKGHFIDNNWNSHCLMLNVVRIPSLKDDALNLAVLTCVSNWRLDGRVFAFTVDQSFLSDTLARNFRTFLVANDPNFLNGQLLLGNCLAQVLCQLAQSALSSMSEVVWKIRESVKYVKTSFVREEKFLELKGQLQVPCTKELSIDNQTKWDTTFHMLTAACELKEVFLYLKESEPTNEPDPSNELSISTDDWKVAETLCTYLKYFFDVANILTSPCYPTANVFFPEVSKIQTELTNASMSQDPLVRDMTKPLKDKFDKYWNDSCLVLAMAVVMDPRYKLKLVKFIFSKVFVQNEEDWTRIVDYGLRDLFLQYTMETLTLSESFGEDGNIDISINETHQEEHQGEIYLTTGDGLSDFDVYISEISENEQTKSELDRYLEEELFPKSQEFDVLSWWRLNRYRYPTLSKMAYDILSMPVSTVPHDSVFDTEIQRIDSYRRSLPPAILEALICTRDWLRYGSLLSPSPSTEMSDAIVKREI
ncbi:Zinc finger BED domain-containing protein DAYSLEEPER, partial [Cucurbita argyrosperma subsp. sororia]